MQRALLKRLNNPNIIPINFTVAPLSEGIYIYLSSCTTKMVDGLDLYRAFLTSGHSKCFTILPHIHPFIHTFTHQRRCQPCRATASWSGAVRVRCLYQGHFETRRGGTGDQTSNLLVVTLYLFSHWNNSMLLHQRPLKPSIFLVNHVSIAVRNYLQV